MKPFSQTWTIDLNNNPYYRAEIEEPDGGERLPGIPTVMNRVVQQAIAQVLSPFPDPEFSASSFGYRPGKSAQDAVQQVKGYIPAVMTSCERQG